MGTPSQVEYLTIEAVRGIHAAALAEWGGAAGERDPGGLESAVAQPQASFSGIDLHPTLWDKAAAYAFYISERQPFLDGNKRAAGISAITFLRLNGVTLRDDCDAEIYKAMINIATKTLSRENLAITLSLLQAP